MKKLFAVLVVMLLFVILACSSKGGDSNTPATYTISGTVMLDDTALSGVTVNMTGSATASTTTDANGNYSFTGQANGNYTVTPSLTGYTFNSPSAGANVNGANVPNINFVAVFSNSSEFEIGQGGGDGDQSSSCLERGHNDGSYRGIITYSNGVDSSGDCTHNVNPSGESEGSYGYQYQCVEYVNRFYTDPNGLNYQGYTCGGGPPNGHMTNCGNAVDYYYNYKALGLFQYPNGGNVPPKPDDILVFHQTTAPPKCCVDTNCPSDCAKCPTGCGHVAIVRAVYDDKITIIQQNWYNNLNDDAANIEMIVNPGVSYNVDSLMSFSHSYAVLGWLRRPVTLNPQLIIATSSGIPGTVFALSGTGFSASSSVTTHLMQPDGTELSTSGLSTDSSGNYSYNVNSSSFIPGDYYAWGVDNSTNTTSNIVRLTIVSSTGVITVNLTNISLSNSPQKLGQDSNYIYWTEYVGNAGGDIKKVSKSGGSVFTLISGLSNPSGLSDPREIAVDSSNIYWTDIGTNASGVGIINQIPLSLTNWNITVLANGQSSPQALAIDTSYVYWAEFLTGKIKKVPINGGTVSTLVSGLTAGFYSLAIDNNYLYWTEANTGSVKKLDKTNNSVTVLVSGLCSPGNISIDSSNVYWEDSAYGPACGIRKISKSGGTITPLYLNIPNGTSTGFMTDGINVYYTQYYLGASIYKIPVGGGSPTLVVGSLDTIADLTVDGTYVYWIENGSVTRRVAKIAK